MSPTWLANSRRFYLWGQGGFGWEPSSQQLFGSLCVTLCLSQKKLAPFTKGPKKTFGDSTTGFHTKWRLKQRRNSILITCHYPDRGSASDWSCWVGKLIQPIRNTTQIWVVMRHQYGISALVSQTSFGRKTSGGVAKCRLLSQATFIQFFLGKTLWQNLSVGKSLSFLQSHVPLNSSICQSEEGLNLFSPEPFWLFISCLHDDANLSTKVIKEQIKESEKLPNVCPWHNKAKRFNKAQERLWSI